MENPNDISCFKTICKCKCTKDSNFIECCLCVIILFTCIITLSIIIYLISGLIILINDYDYSKDCNNSLLAIYVIVSLILVFKGLINSEIDSKCSILRLSIILIFQLFTDICLIIWGGFELFNISLECNDLINSNLWKIGLASFIMQITSFIIVFMALLYMFYNIPKYNNKIIDIETDEN